MAKRLAESVPISQMHIQRDQLAKLSPAAQKLTKGDLVALWENKVTPTAAKVTLGDIELIKAGFAPGMRGGQTAGIDLGDVNCCCCPCCCATAVVRPLRAVA